MASQSKSMSEWSVTVLTKLLESRMLEVTQNRAFKEPLVTDIFLQWRERKKSLPVSPADARVCFTFFTFRLPSKACPTCSSHINCHSLDRLTFGLWRPFVIAFVPNLWRIYQVHPHGWTLSGQYDQAAIVCKLLMQSVHWDIFNGYSNYTHANTNRVKNWTTVW